MLLFNNPITGTSTPHPFSFIASMEQLKGLNHSLHKSVAQINANNVTNWSYQLTTKFMRISITTTTDLVQHIALINGTIIQQGLVHIPPILLQHLYQQAVINIFESSTPVSISTILSSVDKNLPESYKIPNWQTQIANFMTSRPIYNSKEFLLDCNNPLAFIYMLGPSHSQQSIMIWKYMKDCSITMTKTLPENIEEFAFNTTIPSHDSDQDNSTISLEEQSTYEDDKSSTSSYDLELYLDDMKKTYHNSCHGFPDFHYLGWCCNKCHVWGHLPHLCTSKLYYSSLHIETHDPAITTH